MNIMKTNTMKWMVACAALLILPSPAKAELYIVATLPALAQITQEIAGEKATVVSLARVGQDPHFVPGKPTLARHLAKADLLVSAGLALESGWLPPLMALSRNEHILPGREGSFAGSETIDVIGGEATVDRSAGDVHPEGNPHWWLDPLRAAQMGQALAKRLAVLDPTHASDYQQRADIFSKRLQALVASWQHKGVAAQRIVTYHDSYRYFVERFGFNVVGFIEPKPGVEASTKHLSALVEQMKAQQIMQIWSESYHLGRIASRVASATGATLMVMDDAVEGSAGAGYINMIEGILRKAMGE